MEIQCFGYSVTYPRFPETYSFYLDCDGTCVANEESEAELSQIYKSNYNRGDVNMDGATDSKDYSVLANYLWSVIIKVQLPLTQKSDRIEIRKQIR